MEVRDMFQPNPEKAPVLSVTQTPGLASADQLVDVTENELFSFQQSTSETGEFQIVFRPLHQELKEGAQPGFKPPPPRIEDPKLGAGLTQTDGPVKNKVSGAAVAQRLPCDLPVLDGGRYLGGALRREEMYDDDGR